MLKKVKEVLLLTDVQAFADSFESITADLDINLKVEKVWCRIYRVTSDVVILGSKYLERLNEAYYENAVLILKEEENPYPYIQKGITRFIFDYQNRNELLYSLFKNEGIMIGSGAADYESLLRSCNTLKFSTGLYDFDFALDTFKYRGKPIYLTKAAKKYLAEWLLKGHKDNSKRIYLHNLRKGLGEDFLKDIDRFGQVRE